MKRSGFTLVELLVVIVVIAILAALFFPAVTGAIQTARDAEVVVEISNLESSMATFEGRFGMAPPSFIVLVEDAALWSYDWNSSPPIAGLSDLHRRTSRSLIRQLWPDFDFFYGGTSSAPGQMDINDNGSSTDVLVLNGSECLVFFLGGVLDNVDTDGDGVDDSWMSIGFSVNPSSPFTQGGSRVGPFFEFDSKRFVDVEATLGISTTEMMPEYCDPIRGQRVPYQYLSWYSGGSRPFGLDYDSSSGTNLSTVDDELLPKPIGLSDGYWLRSSGIVPQYIQQGQIVSPGNDGEFGIGGSYNGETIPSDRKNERDNITSFSKGRLD